uniref:Paired domain-containing protein n=1 Tax=Strongyloides papillosus TaxID=174720 RepID=A0A0N5BH91_STREA
MSSSNSILMEESSVVSAETIQRTTYRDISNDARNRLIKLVMDQGYSIKDASNMMEINYSSARTIISKFKNQNIISKKPKGGSIKKCLTPEIINEIKEIISENPSYTLKEIKRDIQNIRDSDFQISLSTIDRCLKELGITVKKSHGKLDRVNDPDKIRQRKEYALWFNNYFNNDYSKIVFVDESSFHLHIQRTFSRSKKGTRSNVKVPTIRGRSVTLIASISISQMCHCKVISNSTVDADIFSEYLEELCMYIRDEMKLQAACLILDNARIHKRNEIERITSMFNFDFKFLSPYSYMLNPIENAFSKIKNCVRSRLRNNDNGVLSDVIMSEINNITSTDCNGYFRYITKNITNCAAELPYCHK